MSNARTVVITGAASGIGLATAELFLTLGCTVVGLDVKPCPRSDVRYVFADLADPASIDEAARQAGPWDVLCNVAGVPGTAADDLVMRVNLLGPRQLTERLLPAAGPRAAIVNVASTAGLGWPTHAEPLAALLAAPTYHDGLAWYASAPIDGPAYNVSKEAVIFWTKALASHLLPRGIRVNSVSPGPVDTPILPDFRSAFGTQVIDGSAAYLGRHGQPTEVAQAIAFLAGPSASWINGADVVVDGGLLGAMAVGAVPVPS